MSGAYEYGADAETVPGNAGSPREPDSPATARLPRGQTVGRYVILREVGAGGMGRVYAAYDPELDRTVALKLLHESIAKSPAARARFLREAQSMAKVNHPNVGIIHDVGSARGQAYLAMEFVQGPTLTQWRDPGQGTVAEVLRVYAAAGRGLAAAHSKGLVHRDFKPDNVLVGEDGRVRVMDFGLARAADPTPSVDNDDAQQATPASSNHGGLTVQGDLVGTPGYMAPEQYARKGADTRSDQFSYCVALWDALYGARPYAGANEVELVATFELGELQEPPRRRGPRWLHAALTRGLSVDPEQRWPSMDDLLAELARNRTRARVVLGLAVGAGAVAVTGLGWSAWQQQRARRRCAAEAALGDADWRASAVAPRGAPAHAAKPAGEDAWTRLTEGLDRYTRQWSQLREAACVAARVDGGPEQAYELTAECLDERRAAVTQTVRLLDQADLQLLQRSLSMLLRLPKLDRCLDTVWLGQRARPPTGADGDAVTRVRTDLAQAWVLRAAGKFDDATLRVDQALEDARGLQWEPLVAEAMTQAGLTRTSAGDYSAAETMLREAFLTAGASAHDEAAAEAALGMTYLLGALLHRPDEGLLWADFAGGKLHRLGDSDPLRRAQHLVYLGAVHTAAARFDQAEDAFIAALAVDDQVELLLSARVNLGLMYFNAGRLDDALAEFERSAALREAALGPYHPGVAKVWNNIGSVLAAKGDNERAVDYLERALAIMEVSMGERHPFVATTLGNIGGIYLHLAEPQRALEYHRRAVSIAIEAFGEDSPETGRTRSNLANTFATLGRFDDARPEYERAIAVTEAALGAEHPDLVGLLNNFGHLLLDVDDVTGAVQVFTRSVRVVEAHPTPHPIDQTRSLAGLGAALLRSGDAQGALTHLERAAEAVEASDAGPSDRARAKALLARALVATQREPGRARTLAAEALALYKQAPKRHAQTISDLEQFAAESR